MEAERHTDSERVSRRAQAKNAAFCWRGWESQEYAGRDAEPGVELSEHRHDLLPGNTDPCNAILASASHPDPILSWSLRGDSNS